MVSALSHRMCGLVARNSHDLDTQGPQESHNLPLGLSFPKHNIGGWGSTAGRALGLTHFMRLTGDLYLTGLPLLSLGIWYPIMCSFLKEKPNLLALELLGRFVLRPWDVALLRPQPPCTTLSIHTKPGHARSQVAPELPDTGPGRWCVYGECSHPQSIPR